MNKNTPARGVLHFLEDQSHEPDLIDEFIARHIESYTYAAEEGY
jgi:hypothetical protein